MQKSNLELDNPKRSQKMDTYAQVVLIIFILIRVLIAVGLIYLIYYEVRRMKRVQKQRKDEDGEKTGRHADRTS